jgi:hypothetical protein
MPDLRIVTWNSTGESAAKAGELLAEINYLNATYPATPVMVVLNQEAQNAAGGAIYAMLNIAGAGGIGAAYTRPPAHIQEMLTGGGAGYTELDSTAVAVTAGLTLHNYLADPTFVAWVGALPPNQQTTARNEVTAWRPPAAMELTCGGDTVRLITWHAPLGLSGLLTGCTTTGGAPLDAFLFLDQSDILQGANNPDIVIIAGDLNMTSADLAAKCYAYEPLAQFTGVSSNLDHIVAWLPNGGAPQFFEARSVASSSVHNIVSCRVSW